MGKNSSLPICIYKRVSYRRFFSCVFAAKVRKNEWCMTQSDKKIVEIAVFDFDGTSISGNSPVLLVNYLRRCGLLRSGILAGIAAWGIAYKFRLPQNESWVRGLVFSAFEGTPKEETDRFLADFYDKKIDYRFRSAAEKTIQEHLSCGREVWAVSATFEPIVRQAMKTHGYTRQFSTCMKVDENGCYTREVEGMPVEGKEKLRIVIDKANELYGEGNWVLTHAYGDHHSDRELLAAAQNPCAVTPDNPLRRTAKELGWTILDWK